MAKPFEPGRWRALYRADTSVFDPPYIEKTAEFVRNHALLSSSTLNSRFSTTEGFSIALTRSGMPRLRQSFSVFYEYLEKLAPDRANAFFINPLVVGTGAFIAPHIDCSLNSWTSPERPPFPIKVSVLYLDVPENLRGGTLMLYPPTLSLHFKPTITPQTGLLFEFRGDLRHEVREVETASRPRISLVTEHYCLPPHLLDKIPEFFVKSSREFDSFMDEALGSVVNEEDESKGIRSEEQNSSLA